MPLGSVIVKSSHMKRVLEGSSASRDYSFSDLNKVKAIARVRELDLGVLKSPRYILRGRYACAILS